MPTTPTTQEKLAKFIADDLVANLQAKNLSKGQVYAGDQPKHPMGAFEIRIHAKDRENLGAKTGKARLYVVDLWIGTQKPDERREWKESSLIRAAAEEIVDRYDGSQGGLSLFEAGITDMRFERVRATQEQVTPVIKTKSRQAKVELLITVWE